MPTPPFARAARATRSVEEHRAAVAELLGPSRRAGSARPCPGTRAGRGARRRRRAAAVRQLRDGRLCRARCGRRRRNGGRPASQLPVTADIPAGRTDVPTLAPGTAHRIMTGAPLPAGADAVVQVEHTDGGIDRVRVVRAPVAGTRSAGRGRTSPRGRSCCLRAPCWARRRSACAAAVGAATLPVRRRPTVLVLSTGSELVAPGHAAAAGPDLRVERPHARRRGGGRRRRRRPAAASCPTTSRTCTACSTSAWRPGPSTSCSPRAGSARAPTRWSRTRSRAGASSSSRSPCSRAGPRASGRVGGVAGRRAARQPRQLARLVRGVRASGAASGPRPPAPGAAAGHRSPGGAADVHGGPASVPSRGGRRRRGNRGGGRWPTVAPARSAGASRLLLRRTRGDHGASCRLTRRGVAPRGVM